MKHLLACIATVTLATSFAQEVVSTQGDSYSNSSGSIDFTIGEVVINTVSDGTNDLTQGFHQTHWYFLELEDYVPEFEASIYPNPTEDVLNIRTPYFDDARYVLYDERGRIVAEGLLPQEVTSIPVSHLLPGAYELTLNTLDNAGGLKRFKLIKHK
jgi:hypothetical protein